MKNNMNTANFTKVTLNEEFWKFYYLPNPIHSTKRYNGHYGFRNIACFPGPAGSLLEGHWLDSDNFTIQESSEIHPGIIQDLAGLTGQAGLAGRSRILRLINRNQYKIYSLKKKQTRAESRFYT